MLFPLPLGYGMEELVQHQPRDSFPDYKNRKPCLLRILFGILRSNFPVGSIRFHPIPSILGLITRNRILSHWWYFLLNSKIGIKISTSHQQASSLTSQLPDQMEEPLNEINFQRIEHDERT